MMMTAVSKLAAKTSPERHLRPFDVRRDMNAVADLVELCFSETLDSDGRRYLHYMRSTARNPGLLSWTALSAHWTSAPLTGFVWEQDGRLVGNASMIPFYVGRKRFDLIANVAVHPDYRRQGIARKLTESAIQRARARGAPSVWLHVRDDNPPAVNLYTSLNFIERTRRTTWVSQPQVVAHEPDAGVRFGNPRPGHWDLQRRWLRRAYPPQFAWHLAIDANLLRPGVWGGLWRLINNAHVAQWGMFRQGRLLAVASWQAAPSAADHLLLAAPPDSNENDVHALLVHALQRAPSRRSISMNYPAELFVGAIQDAGFTTRQTLIWMELPLV
jgi:GNAT superfamily N-acetyltransferase